MISREQQYAVSVYAHVQNFRTRYPNENDKNRKRYGSMAHKLPILIRQAGLMQGLAFAHSRRKTPIDTLLEHLANTIGAASAEDLLDRSRRADLSEYIYLTDQVMLALKWYKRFAQSVLKVDSTDEADDGGDND